VTLWYFVKNADKPTKCCVVAYVVVLLLHLKYDVIVLFIFT